MNKAYIFCCCLLLSNFVIAGIHYIEPGEDIQERLQEAMILSKPGDTIQLKEGLYELTDGLSLAQSGVSIKGAGIDKTILDFTHQLSGAQGLLVTSDAVVLKDFSVINAKGDAIKIIGVDGIFIVNVKVEWTNGPATENGAYGLYPVQSKNVYIDGCIAIGASDAGIYVGQSENIIVKNNIAEYNVAGIEIENSYYADVHENSVSKNTGGILIFDLPDLPQQDGHHIRIFDNQISNNNTDNFAPLGNIVASVPRGTGILVMAGSDIEIFDNSIHKNDTINLAIVSYFQETDDENYHPHPRSIYIHDNKFSVSGSNPDSERNELARILESFSGDDMPDIFWDGVIPLSQIIFGQPEEEKVALGENTGALFMTIDPLKYLLPFIDPLNSNYDDFMTHRSSLRKIVIDIPFERLD